MRDTINFLLAGVGGQGTVLASDVLVNVGMAAGLQAKQAEVHGMSQRGGSVVSHVRWGQVVHSPLVGAGEVDVLLAFEKVEALRRLDQLRPGAIALINMQAIEPITITSGGQTYPDDRQLRSAFSQVTGAATFLDGAAIAEGLGNVRAANVVLLGALSELLDRSGWSWDGLTPQIWLDAIIQRVPPRYVDLNRQAFASGRQAI